MQKKKIVEKIVKSKIYTLMLLILSVIGIIVIAYKVFYNLVGGSFWGMKLTIITDAFTAYIIIISMIVIGVKARFEKELSTIYSLMNLMWFLAVIECALHIL